MTSTETVETEVKTKAPKRPELTKEAIEAIDGKNLAKSLALELFDEYETAMLRVKDLDDNGAEARKEAENDFRASDDFAQFESKLAELEAAEAKVAAARAAINAKMEPFIVAFMPESTGDPKAIRENAQAARRELSDALDLISRGASKKFLIPNVRVTGGSSKTDGATDYFVDSKGNQHLKSDVREWGIKNNLAQERGKISAACYEAYDKAMNS